MESRNPGVRVNGCWRISSGSQKAQGTELFGLGPDLGNLSSTNPH